ncbi:aspartyl-phosphate phosphatase Spo0E family protein [Falsibacillus albus]|uniref:Aspartyl-phosphate phosphatase Spo0E family protein n=1 Tax=Falsibacillus albus TaxID=2478915 RepID=A0A3L7JT77_9BACI|nr:aspartyl-phosphate phosphatase Spo0E family protein [Falsibacillus albus]RLQ93249.1 aspartyl-phosphate phosphatase Spo0E family protein [Falsibacillus albus]
MEVNITELLKEIEENRKKMVQLALKSSFADDQVVQISWKLDSLLNRYEEMAQKI